MDQKENGKSRINTERIRLVCVAFFVLVSTAVFLWRSLREESGGVLSFDASVREEQTFLTESGPGEEAVSSEAAEPGTEQPEVRMISVFVCGAVRQPDVYVLPGDARVKDAIAAAGGFREDADIAYWNQAAFLYGEEKIYVPTKEEASLSGGGLPYGDPAAEGASAAGGAAAKEEKIDINTAAAEDFMSLPGIGETKANAIVAFRDENGKFQTLEELMLVPGIKEASFNKIKEYITLTD